MITSKTEEYPSEARRMEIFLALVEVQDSGTVSVPQSRRVISDRFGITEKLIRQIETEGLDRQWPPL